MQICFWSYSNAWNYLPFPIPFAYLSYWTVAQEASQCLKFTHDAFGFHIYYLTLKCTAVLRFRCQATRLRYTQRIIIDLLKAMWTSLKTLDHSVCRLSLCLVCFRMLPLSLPLVYFIQCKTNSFFIQLNRPHCTKKAGLELFWRKSQVKGLFLCIYQTYVTNWRWQHGPQYLNGSRCFYCDGYEMTWWAINMSDMTQMSSERIWQQSIHTRFCLGLCWKPIEEHSSKTQSVY